jgi:L-aspartate oxidase
VFLNLTRACRSAWIAIFDVLVIGSGAAGLSAALDLAPDLKVGVLAKGGISPARPRWRRAGSPRCSSRRHVRKPYRGHDDRRRGPQRPPTVEFVVENAPGGDRAAGRARRAVQPGETDRWHLTREGGHSHRRIVHVADATGWAVQQALEKAAREHPNISLIPDMVAIDLVTSRHRRPASGRCASGASMRRSRKAAVSLLTGRATDPRHRRRQPGLALFDQPARLDRRRHRHGLARRLPRFQHGVQPVPPDLPLPP